METNRRTIITTLSVICLTAGCLVEERLDERGDIEIRIDDTPVDLTADRYQAEHASNHSIEFHLHEFDEYWYMEGTERVTFAQAIDLLPHFAYDQHDGSHLVTVDGTTYDETDGETEITFRVNETAVSPTEYTVQDGDNLLVTIDTDG